MVEINYDSRAKYSSGSQIRFKTTMLKSRLCDYSDAYTLVKEIISIIGNGANDDAKPADETDKEVVYKNCAPFSRCISQIKNMQVDDAQEIDVVMPMYNLIEHSNNYSKTSGSL